MPRQIGWTFRSAWLPALIWLYSCACGSGTAVAQDLEPRRWTHLPIDTNVVGVSYLFTTGEISFDPVLRIDDATVDMHTVVLSYLRTFSLFDKTARIDVLVPYQAGHWEGLVDGEPRSVSRDGLADPTLRLSVNLAGAPALKGEEFMEYRRTHTTNTVVGAALGIGAPLGEYMDDKLINLGENRFVIWPQVGAVHTRGPWSFELTGSVFFYTENDEFFNGNTIERDPLFALQGHVVRTLGKGVWVAGGIAYGWGGESRLNGVSANDQRRNLLYGAAFGFPLSPSQSVRLAYIRRDSLTDLGSDTHNFLASLSIRF